MTNEERKSAYQMLYTKISKVTAEIDGQKQIYRGQLKDLFSDVKVSTATITRFMWAITRKTSVLPTMLFSVKKDGNKGVIVERLHSGFYDNAGKHIVGMDLIPFIMRAVGLHQVKASKNTKIVDEKKYTETLLVEVASDLSDLTGVSDDALAAFGKDAQDRLNKAKADLEKYNEEVKRREEVRKKQQSLREVLELMDMNIDELKSLLNCK